MLDVMKVKLLQRYRHIGILLASECIECSFSCKDAINSTSQLTPSFMDMDAWITSKLNVDFISKLC